MVDQPDQAEILPDGHTLLFRDGGNPWFAAVTTDGEIGAIDVDPNLPAPQQTVGKGVSGRFTVPLHFDDEGNCRCTFFIAGSTDSADDVLATLRNLQRNHSLLGNGKTMTDGIIQE